VSTSYKNQILFAGKGFAHRDNMPRKGFIWTFPTKPIELSLGFISTGGDAEWLHYKEVIVVVKKMPSKHTPDEAYLQVKGVGVYPLFQGVYSEYIMLPENALGFAHGKREINLLNYMGKDKETLQVGGSE